MVLFTQSASSPLATMVAKCYHSNMPAYPAEQVRRLAALPGSRRALRAALDGCAMMGWSVDVVWETLHGVGEQNCQFVKSVDSDKRPGEKLDVYDAIVEGREVYIKVKIVPGNSNEQSLLVVLSFKRNEYYERNMR